MSETDSFSMEAEFVLVVMPARAYRGMAKDAAVAATLPLATIREVMMWAQQRGLVLAKAKNGAPVGEEGDDDAAVGLETNGGR